MNNKITQEEIDEYQSNVPDFIMSGEISIADSILLIEKKVEEQSIACLDDSFKEPKRLFLAILTFILRCKSGIEGKIEKDTSEKLTLIVNYFQSIHHTESLLLKGQYIAVAALMKKDFETMVKLAEIKAGKARYGKSPNAMYAPKELKFIYGQLNDIAHVSKNHVIGFYLEKIGDNSKKGVSPSPQFKEEQFKAFYTYHISILQHIVAESISLYQEMYGMDKNHKDMWAYFLIANNAIGKINEKYIKGFNDGDEEE